MLLGFLQNNASELGLSDDDIIAEAVQDGIVCYGKGMLNGVPISTVKAEDKKKTCDSIVCGRYMVGDDENEVFYIGQVQHIASYLGHTLLCVKWFDMGNLNDDQKVGLTVIPVAMLRVQTEMWIDVGSIVIQKHVMVRPYPNSRSRTFHIAIKP